MSTETTMTGRSGRHRPDDSEAEFLAGYDPQVFPPFAVTVDVVILTIYEGALAVLLVERQEHPHRGTWALPGGFVAQQDDLETTAWRILARETGVTALPDGIHLEQIATFGQPDRDPRMRVVSVTYLALSPGIALPSAVTAEGHVRLWPVKEVLDDEAPGLAFDHRRIVSEGVERARSKLEYTTIALSFVPEPLTLADLRRVYEIVWDTVLDPTNFRRSVLETDCFVIPLNGMLRRDHESGRGRPATLYRKGSARLLSHVIRRPSQ